MELAETRVISYPEEQGMQRLTEMQPRALSAQTAARDLHKAVLKDATRQLHREEETRALAPDAYRLSLLSEVAVSARYRRGKSEMSVSDLVRYFSETRARRIQNVDFSGNTGMDVYESAVETVQEQAALETPANTLSTRVKEISQSAGNRLKRAMPTWFDGAKADTSKEQKRFPLSAFVAAVVIAISLMLIIASSVMLMRTESAIGDLKNELSVISDEVSELRSDFNVKYDLLEIRRIAMEEYGMVKGDYVKVGSLDLKAEDSVEIYDTEREEQVGLSAILSAMGIK
ncbi:MAG: hypothetical protein IKA05_09305 [Clostridia bacterium]|nr:hypothetical protein [Clostridia bacterium]